MRAWIVSEVVERKCMTPIYYMGYEAREVEPQPCGNKATWKLKDRTACSEHIGVELDAIARQHT
jgi:hypothetical protein